MYHIVHHRQVQLTVHKALHRRLLRDRGLMVLALCSLLRMEVHRGLGVAIFRIFLNGSRHLASFLRNRTRDNWGLLRLTLPGEWDGRHLLLLLGCLGSLMIDHIDCLFFGYTLQLGLSVKVVHADRSADLLRKRSDRSRVGHLADMLVHVHLVDALHLCQGLTVICLGHGFGGDGAFLSGSDCLSTVVDLLGLRNRVV